MVTWAIEIVSWRVATLPASSSIFKPPASTTVRAPPTMWIPIFTEVSVTAFRADKSPKRAEMWVREVGAAGLGCAVADSIFNSLEVLKVRAQLAPTSEPMLQLAARIFRSGGIAALAAPGLGATQLRALTYTGFRIGAYPEAKRRIGRAMDVSDNTEPLGLRVAAGMTTGGIGSALFTPVDLVRVRMQSNPRLYAHVPAVARTAYAFVHVARAEGLRQGLYRGLSACVLRGTLLSASQLTTYDLTKQLLRRARDEGPTLHMCASCISGLVAQTFIQPVDTLKTLMMRPPPELPASTAGPPQAAGSLGECLAALVRSGGPAALYRGYGPALLRQGPVIMVQMPLIEQLRRVFGVGYM